jgi:hypothetical protein
VLSTSTARFSAPSSRIVPDPTPGPPERMIDYPLIDGGRTRRERSAEIIDANNERAHVRKSVQREIEE